MVIDVRNMTTHPGRAFQAIFIRGIIPLAMMYLLKCLALGTVDLEIFDNSRCVIQMPWQML
jgi:hypothetical protein